MIRRTGCRRVATSFLHNFWGGQELFILNKADPLVRIGKLDAGHCPPLADIWKPEWSNPHRFAAREPTQLYSFYPGADR